MRRRWHRRNLVVWTSSARYGAPRVRRPARAGRIRRWIRIGMLLAVIGLMRLPRTVRTHWRPTLLLAGGAPMAAGVILSSGVTFLLGLLVLVLTLLIPSDHPPPAFVDPALMPFLVDRPSSSMPPSTGRQPAERSTCPAGHGPSANQPRVTDGAGERGRARLIGYRGSKPPL